MLDALNQFLEETHDTREYKRALAVKMAHEGIAYAVIAAMLQVSKPFISKWKRIAAEAGIDGLRRGELVALAWRDVDLDTGTLRVRASKTAAGVRTIALSSMLVQVLRAHWAFQLQERRAQGLNWKEQSLVFPSSVGTPLSARNLYRHFKSVLTKAGLPDVPFHWLRHTALTRLAEANTPPAVLQAIAGHTKFSTTAEIYVHVAADQQQECIAKMSALYV